MKGVQIWFVSLVLSLITVVFSTIIIEDVREFTYSEMVVVGFLIWILWIELFKLNENYNRGKK